MAGDLVASAHDRQFADVTCRQVLAGGASREGGTSVSRKPQRRPMPDCLMGSFERPASEGSPLDVVRACLEAHRAEDWPKLRRLFHPQAKIGVFANGGYPDDPEKAITKMTAAHADALYHADVQSALELDEYAVLLSGSVRYPAEDGGFNHVQRSWLYVVVDGRLYRSQVFETSEEAKAAYVEHGRDLGVD